MRWNFRNSTRIAQRHFVALHRWICCPIWLPLEIQTRLAPSAEAVFLCGSLGSLATDSAWGNRWASCVGFWGPFNFPYDSYEIAWSVLRMGRFAKFHSEWAIRSHDTQGDAYRATREAARCTSNGLHSISIKFVGGYCAYCKQHINISFFMKDQMEYCIWSLPSRKPENGRDSLGLTAIEALEILCCQGEVFETNPAEPNPAPNASIKRAISWRAFPPFAILPWPQVRGPLIVSLSYLVTTSCTYCISVKIMSDNESESSSDNLPHQLPFAIGGNHHAAIPFNNLFRILGPMMGKLPCWVPPKER